jgi:hypothetical protein
MGIWTYIGLFIYTNYLFKYNKEEKSLNSEAECRYTIFGVFLPRFGIALYIFLTAWLMMMNPIQDLQ